MSGYQWRRYQSLQPRAVCTPHQTYKLHNAILLYNRTNNLAGSFISRSFMLLVGRQELHPAWRRPTTRVSKSINQSINQTTKTHFCRVVVLALSASPPPPTGIDRASRNCTTSLGRAQRSFGVRSIDFSGQLKRWCTMHIMRWLFTFVL